MPFYEYECPHCGYQDEVLQKINDKPLKKCPTCGKAGLKKLMSAPVFRLKGSGWYETDFKSDKENKRNLAGAEKDEAKSEPKADKPDKADKADKVDKADSKAEPKSEAKVESKTEAKPDKQAGAKSAAVKPNRARSKTKVKPARPAKRR